MTNMADFLIDSIYMILLKSDFSIINLIITKIKNASYLNYVSCISQHRKNLPTEYTPAFEVD